VSIFENINSSLFLMGLIVSIFYIPLLIFMMKTLKQKNARKQFFHATKSILERVESNDEAVKQIQIVFKKLTERHPYVRQAYKSAPDFLEDYLCRIESFGNERFKDAYKFDLDDAQKNRLIEIIDSIKSKQPFSTISSKYGNLLSMVSHAFDTDNHDLGKTNLRQLSDDIEVLESTIEQQSRTNQVSLVISVVGVILTVVFGALTVIQYIFPTGISG